jgi:hypothetical protein
MPQYDRESPSTYFRAARRASTSAPASHLISIRLPDELMHRLAAVGNEEGLAMSDTIRLVLERGLAAPPKRPTTTTSATTTRRKKRT